MSEGNGEVVYKPTSALNPLNPENGVVYDDELYAQSQAADPVVETPEVVTETEPAAEIVAEPTAPVIDYDAIVKEKTGGKYEKWEDVLSRLDTPAIEFSNESSKKVFDYIKEGKLEEVSNFLNQQKFLSKIADLDPEEVIKAKMQIDNPDFSTEDIEDEYDELYGLSEDADDKSKRRVERLKKVAEKTAKEYLTGLKDTLTLPDLVKPVADAPENPFAERVTELNKLSELFAESVKDSLPKFNELDLSVIDQDFNFAHSFKLSEQEKADLGTKVQYYWNTLQSRYYKDGKYDATQLFKDQYILDNFHKINKSVATKAYNQGKLEHVKSLANVNLDPAPSANSDWAKDAYADGARKFINA